MPTWIVTHSEFLCNFLTPLLVGFSPAQLCHALNCVEALLVCTARHKTLAALTRWLRLDPTPTNMPWPTSCASVPGRARRYAPPCCALCCRP
jgi:hypothetical protein